jgi:hypothetical protein
VGEIWVTVQALLEAGADPSTRDKVVIPHTRNIVQQ